MVAVYVELLVVTAICVTNLVHSFTIDKRLKVLTYNTALLDRPLKPGVTNNRIERRDGIINALKDQDSDVVCLQEVFIGQDVELIVEGLKTEYPNSFSQLHIFNGSLPPQQHGYQSPPCNRDLLTNFTQCLVVNSCIYVPITDFRECVLTNCEFQQRELIAYGGSQCVNCLFSTDLANTLEECSSDTAGIGPRHMNPSGLLLLSRKPLTSMTFVEYYPTTIEFVSYGYITAGTAYDIDVACTHLSPYEQYTVEFELYKYFPTYAAQTVNEINHLVDVFSKRSPTILMGDLNVGPGRQYLTPFGSEHYNKLTEAFHTKLISACTFCSGEQVVYNAGEVGTNTALDHVMANCRNIKIMSVKRMFTDTYTLDSLHLSDHFGVQAEIIILGWKKYV